MANERTTWREAFKMADQVLYMGVRGVTDLMMAPGLVNLDFADIRTVMAEMGKAMMGTGEAEGENRAIRAAEAAISNPLLEDTSMAGARGLLINITGGDDLTLFEVDQAANRIREEVDEEANIIFGSAIDESLSGRIRVSVVATGIDSPAMAEHDRPRLVAVGGNAMPMPQPIPLPMQAMVTSGRVAPGWHGAGARHDDRAATAAPGRSANGRSDAVHAGDGAAHGGNDRTSVGVARRAAATRAIDRVASRPVCRGAASQRAGSGAAGGRTVPPQSVRHGHRGVPSATEHTDDPRRAAAGSRRADGAAGGAAGRTTARLGPSDCRRRGRAGHTGLPPAPVVLVPASGGTNRQLKTAKSKASTDTLRNKH